LQQFSGAAAALREAIRLQPDLAVAQQALSSLPAAK